MYVPPSFKITASNGPHSEILEPPVVYTPPKLLRLYERIRSWPSEKYNNDAEKSNADN